MSVTVNVPRELLVRITSDEEGVSSLADIEELKRILAQQDPVQAEHDRPCEGQSATDDRDAVLADRMRAAGMLTIDEMLSGAPLDRFIQHAGVTDLETFGQWLDMKCREFLSMQASRELERKQDDDLYEWVLAHAAVFQEARINFKAARQALQDKRQPDDTMRLDFILEKPRKVVIERLPSGGDFDRLEIYVEEGVMGDQRYPAVTFSGDWKSDAKRAAETKRQAIDAALSGQGDGQKAAP